VVVAVGVVVGCGVVVGGGMLYNFTHFREQSSRKCVKFALKRGFSSDFHEFPRFFFLFRRVFHEFARGLKKKNEKVGRKMRYPI